jgi:putative SOS response-associated peptidase YedK
VCGRFVSSSTPDELARYFGAAPPDEAVTAGFEPNFNVAPSNDIYAVYESTRGPSGERDPDGEAVRRLDALRWGLVPSWAKDLSVGNRMINARAESLLAKNAYRRAFERRRCLIPADGFFEWQKVPGRRTKQPYYLCGRDGEPLALAGLWEVWRDPATEGASATWLRSCTIVTTSANEVVAALHDRMPVILPASAWDAWLDPDNHDTEALERLLVPAPAGLLAVHPVADDVGNVRNQGPHLIEPVATPASAADRPAVAAAPKARRATPRQGSLLDLE